MSPRILVVLLGNARGGEFAWRSIFRNVIAPNRADMALMFGHTDDHTSSLYKRAKYVWECPEYKDWGDAYDMFSGGNNWRETWVKSREFAKSAGSGLFGGIKGHGGGSGAIIFALRLFLADKLRDIQVQAEYDWVLVTRPDYYVALPVTWNKTGDYVHVPSGEDYAGITDRWFACRACDVINALNVVGPLLRHSSAPAQYLSLHKPQDGIWNPEKVIAAAWKCQGIFGKVKRFDRCMFTVAGNKDTSRWCQPSGRGELGFGLPPQIKYRSELADARNTVKHAGLPGIPLIADDAGRVEFRKPTAWRSGAQDRVHAGAMLVWEGYGGWAEYAVQWPHGTPRSVLARVSVLLNAAEARPMNLSARVPDSFYRVVKHGCCGDQTGDWYEVGRMKWFPQGVVDIPVDEDGFTVLKLSAAQDSYSPHIGGLQITIHNSANPPARPVPSLFYFVPYGRNFGDELNELIIDRLCSKLDLPRVRCINKANKTSCTGASGKSFSLIGSILHHKYLHSSDIIGTGVNPNHKHDKSLWPGRRLIAVRGPRTEKFLRDRFGYSGRKPVYGDPALLIPTLFPEWLSYPERDQGIDRKRVGLIPHHNDLAHCVAHKSRLASLGIDVCSTCEPIQTVVGFINQKEVIISSSLHGIIVSEMLGKKTTWLQYPGSAESEGQFKYLDYYEATGRKGVIPAASIADALAVEIPEPRYDPWPLFHALRRYLIV